MPEMIDVRITFTLEAFTIVSKGERMSRTKRALVNNRQVLNAHLGILGTDIGMVPDEQYEDHRGDVPPRRGPLMVKPSAVA